MNKPSEDGVRCVDCGDRISTPWYARVRARFFLAVQAYERHMNNEKAVLELKTELARVIQSRENIFRKSVGFHQQMLAAQHELAVQKERWDETVELARAARASKREGQDE